MPKRISIKRSPRKYWEGKGRRILMIPNTALYKQVAKNSFFTNVYLTDMGYYPKAESHFVERKNGSPENIIFYCADGKGWYETSLGRFKVYPNQFFILPRNEWHCYGSDPEEPWSINWIMFAGDLSKELNMLHAVKHCFKPSNLLSFQRFIELFDEMFEALSMGYGMDNLVFANLNLWFILMLFTYENRHKNKKQQDAPVEKAICFLKENIDRKLSINEIANAIDYSPPHLYNLFKKQTGYSPIDYFIHLKVQKACHYLNFTPLKVKEIAPLIGYDDPYHFSRIFAQVMGQSPQQFRLRARV